MPTFSRFLFLLLSLTSCSVGPAYQAPTIDLPEEWKTTRKEKAQECEEKRFEYLEYWWQIFQDEKLDELEKLALDNNRDLYAAFERIKEAQALTGIAKADFYPQITLNPLFTNSVLLNKTYRNPNALPTTSTNNIGPLGNSSNNINNLFRIHELLYSLPINLSYEVDLWGKISDAYRSTVYNWHAQQKDYEAIMLSLTANLATAYYQLRSLDSQLELLLKVFQTRQKALTINQDRFEADIVNYADVTLAAEDLDSAKAQHQEITRQRQIIENQIAVLIGTPAPDFCLKANPLQGLPPEIPEGLPSEMLMRRPDISEAEFRVQSNHALVKQAYSLFFPSLTLTATAGFESPVLKDFLKWISRYWLNGTQVNQIVFDGNRTASHLQLQLARFKESSGAYQQQVLIAFQDVENALTNLESYAKQYEIDQATVEWSQKTYQLYLDRYQFGVAYYIDVANTERDLLFYQINLNTVQGLRYLSTIQLIKALGGGW